MRTFWVYLLASPSGTLYTGVTNDLHRRLQEHRDGVLRGFTKKYGCKKLVFFQETKDIHAAISEEKRIKGWRRSKKEDLIRRFNPRWKDLSYEIGLEA